MCKGMSRHNQTRRGTTWHSHRAKKFPQDVLRRWGKSQPCQTNVSYVLEEIGDAWDASSHPWNVRNIKDMRTNCEDASSWNVGKSVFDIQNDKKKLT
jgi:hypothetical protein